MSTSESDWCDWIDNRVCVKGILLGTLKFFGETHFSEDLLCGISLDHSFGKYDGMVDGKRYFTCRPDCGIFVPLSKVTRIKETLNENLLDEKNLNETFEVLKIHDNVINEIETRPANFASEIKVERNSKPRSDLEESLGILPLDVIDLDISSELIVFENNKTESLNNEYMQIGEKPDSIFEFPSIRTLSESIPDTVFPPKYASTPRHMATKKFKSDLNDESTFINDHKDFDGSFLNSSEVICEIENFKDNPNLTSTSKIFDSCGILDINNKDPIQHKDIDAYEELNKNTIFTNQFENNGAEFLSVTFDLKEITLTACSNESDKVLNVDTSKVYFSENNKVIDKSENINEIICSDNLCQLNVNSKFTFPGENANLNKLQTNLHIKPTLDTNENIAPYSDKSDSPCDIANRMLEDTFIVPSPVKEASNYKQSTVSLQANQISKPDMSKRKTICFFGTKSKTVRFADNVSEQSELNSTFHKINSNILLDSNVDSQPKNRKRMSAIQSTSKVKNTDEFKKPFLLNIRRSSRLALKSKIIESNSEISNTPLEPNLSKIKSNFLKIASTKPDKEKKSDIKLSRKLKSKLPINIPNIQSSTKSLKIGKLCNAIDDCSIPTRTNGNNLRQSIKDSQTEISYKSLPSNRTENLIEDTKLPVSYNTKHAYQSHSKSSRISSINEFPKLPSNVPVSEAFATKRNLIKEIQKPCLRAKENSVLLKLPRRKSLIVPAKTKLPVETVNKRSSVLPTILGETSENVESSSSKNSKPSVQPLSLTTSALTNGSSVSSFVKKNGNLRKSMSRKSIVEPSFGFRLSTSRKNV